MNNILPWLLLSNLYLSQTSLSIIEFHPFTEKMKLLDLKPSKINWSFDNRFLLIDKYKQEIFQLDKFGNLNTNNPLNYNSNMYGDLVWVGVSPIGIQVLDRLENQVLIFDHNLNPITNIKIEKKIFPDAVTIDSWGNLYFYSKTYNSVYTFKGNELGKQPFIDLGTVFSNTFCTQDISINQNFELGILDCNGILHIFNRNGKKKKSVNTVIDKSEFLIPSRNDWLVFNSKGVGISINDQNSIIIPNFNTSIIDIANLNRSLAVLSSDHILIMDVK